MFDHSEWVKLFDLTVSVDHVFIAGQFTKSTWPASVKLVRTDSDLRAQPKLAAVIETRAGVDHHGRTINFIDKLTRRN